MIVTFTSGKGGTGSSCCAAYTAAAFASAGKRTILIEMGSSPRSADLILGTQNDIVFDYSDVVSGRCDVKKAVVKTIYHKELFLLPGPLIPFVYMPEITWYQEIFYYLSEVFDVIILDAANFHSFPPTLSDTIIIVTTPDSLAIRAASIHARGLFDAEAKSLKLAINCVSPQVMPMYGARDFDDVIDTIGAQLIAVIPESPILRYCSNNAQVIDDGSLTVQVFDNIVKRLMGQHPHLLVK